MGLSVKTKTHGFINQGTSKSKTKGTAVIVTKSKFLKQHTNNHNNLLSTDEKKNRALALANASLRQKIQLDNDCEKWDKKNNNENQSGINEKNKPSNLPNFINKNSRRETISNKSHDERPEKQIKNKKISLTKRDSKKITLAEL